MLSQGSGPFMTATTLWEPARYWTALLLGVGGFPGVGCRWPPCSGRPRADDWAGMPAEPWRAPQPRSGRCGRMAAWPVVGVLLDHARPYFRKTLRTALEQVEDVGGNGVGLRQGKGARLDQHLVAGIGGGLVGKVDVHHPGIGVFQVEFGGGEVGHR